MVLEFLDGDDLAIVLRSRGPLPIADVADYVLEAIDALALGIVHRDLKPSNLFLVRRQDGSARVKVLDFGISKMMGAQGVGSGNTTKTNAMLGSPLCMSPEQLRDSKSVDHRRDIWALGVIAYELLTSHPPFMADRGERDSGLKRQARTNRRGAPREGVRGTTPRVVSVAPGAPAGGEAASSREVYPRGRARVEPAAKRLARAAPPTVTRSASASEASVLKRGALLSGR